MPAPASDLICGNGEESKVHCIYNTGTNLMRFFRAAGTNYKHDDATVGRRDLTRSPRLSLDCWRAVQFSVRLGKLPHDNAA